MSVPVWTLLGFAAWTLAVLLLAARIAQSSVHVAFIQTDRVVGVRFSFFLVQLVCMVWMGIYTAVHA